MSLKALRGGEVTVGDMFAPLTDRRRDAALMFGALLAAVVVAASLLAAPFMDVDMEKLVGAASISAARRQAIERLQKRNGELQEEARVVREILGELRTELDNLRWSINEEKVLALDPKMTKLNRENTELEKTLREAKDEARKMMQEIRKLKEEMKKRPGRACPCVRRSPRRPRRSGAFQPRRSSPSAATNRWPPRSESRHRDARRPRRDRATPRPYRTSEPTCCRWPRDTGAQCARRPPLPRRLRIP